MTTRRFSLKWLLVLVALLVIPVLIAPLVPLDFLKPAVESRLSTMLGRKVAVNSIRLSLWGGPYLTIGGMMAKESPDFGDDYFLKADQVRADFAVFQYLFHQEIAIDALEIKSPEFTLVKNREGVWSWTTIGEQPPDSQSAARATVLNNAETLHAAFAMLGNILSSAQLRSIEIEDASVRLINLAGAQPSESLYKHIALRASLAPIADKTGSRATGELRADSTEDEAAEILKTTLPFDLNISREPLGLLIDGSVGPGPFETRNFAAANFTVNCQLNAQRRIDARPTEPQQSPSNIHGTGHISCSGVILPRINISERVASRLSVNQIGDMNPGTSIGNLETDFQVEQGVYKTTGLRIQQLDGLGDAIADQGWFKTEPALLLNYNATIRLSDEATKQVKATSPVVGLIVELLENNNRLALALNIAGDVRSPQISVDVLRTLGL
ncbi:MAG TPA: AsmA family protein [Blastocatellia bacterium]|nr:AsmA family protein [Blastocatellia bacterium]